jgi:hypothetical protein
METKSDNRTPEEKRKDTSAPGREEEVIVNTREQHRLTNKDEETDLPKEEVSSEKESLPKKDKQAERAFKEGLANNSDTESSE